MKGGKRDKKREVKWDIRKRKRKKMEIREEK
jgi:hypothetical protein